MSALPSRLVAAGTRKALAYVAVGVVLVAAVALAGDELQHHTAALEAWIAALGPLGMVAFVALFAVATSLTLPETLLALLAGAAFGLLWGFLAVAAGNLLAAALQYALARRLLRARIDRAVAARPTMASIQRAVHGDQSRLQALLRVTPLNPASLSYALGAGGVRFVPFLLACLALLPNALIEVYAGYAGKHAVKMAGRSGDALLVHDAVAFGGLAVTILIIVFIARLAHSAVIQAVDATPGTPDLAGPAG